MIDGRQDIEERTPHAFLVCRIVGPKAVVGNALITFQPKPDQVVKITIWKPLDIKIYRRSLDLELRITDEMYLFFAESQRLQRVVVFLGSSRQSLGAAAWTKSVRELVDRQNAFAV